MTEPNSTEPNSAEPNVPAERPATEPRQKAFHESSSGRARGTGGPADAVYGLGLIGALVYFWQQATSFWEYVLAVLKSLVWPALLVYDALRSLKG